MTRDTSRKIYCVWMGTEMILDVSTLCSNGIHEEFVYVRSHEWLPKVIRVTFRHQMNITIPTLVLVPSDDCHFVPTLSRVHSHIQTKFHCKPSQVSSYQRIGHSSTHLDTILMLQMDSQCQPRLKTHRVQLQ